MSKEARSFMSSIGRSVLSAIIKGDRPMEARREGLYGTDLPKIGQIFTDWGRIKEVIIQKESIILTERINTIIKNQETGALEILHHVHPEEADAKARSGSVNSQGQPLFTREGGYVERILLPKDNGKRDPQVINSWKHIQGAVILWARQSGEFAKMKDRRVIYNLDIPNFVFTVEPELDEISEAEGLNFSVGEEYKSDKITNFGSNSTYATKEEFVQELKRLAAQRTSGRYIPEQKQKVIMPDFEWQSMQLGSV